VPVTQVAEAYLGIAHDTDLLWVLDGVERSTTADYWESMAAAAVSTKRSRPSIT
jgi:NAD-specific glutamate dehydrogenase